jgi:hypothetical protein
MNSPTKQLGVKTNRTSSFLRGNRNGHHIMALNVYQLT